MGEDGFDGHMEGMETVKESINEGIEPGLERIDRQSAPAPRRFQNGFVMAPQSDENGSHDVTVVDGHAAVAKPNSEMGLPSILGPPLKSPGIIRGRDGGVLMLDTTLVESTAYVGVSSSLTIDAHNSTMSFKTNASAFDSYAPPSAIASVSFGNDLSTLGVGETNRGSELKRVVKLAILPTKRLVIISGGAKIQVTKCFEEEDLDEMFGKPRDQSKQGTTLGDSFHFTHLEGSLGTYLSCMELCTGKTNLGYSLGDGQFNANIPEWVAGRKIFYWERELCSFGL
ncbi:hypothetical protein L6452_43404 [Arctium lappa]|uniref:Uncharacterized protein n=1 Tax=Arctium lappa TaxID=4217 RepID=A0ACB8XDZ3_ARCLA|nr:hypothetical protein L6452_43404 [Arctium lappa]